MTRQEEIKVLQSLKEDTYLAQVFKPETIDAMCENIRLDRQIDCLVNMFDNLPELVKAKAEIKTLKGQMEERENEIKDLHEQKDKMMDFLLRIADDEVSEKEINNMVIETIGRKEMMRKKLNLNLELSDEDKLWLINNL